jgi:NADH:ubiquinone oxidoreductase subunit E
MFLRMLERRGGIDGVEVTASPCIGCCDKAPAILEDNVVIGKLTARSLARELHRIGRAC